MASKCQAYEESIGYMLSSIELRKRKKCKKQYSSFCLTTPMEFRLSVKPQNFIFAFKDFFLFWMVILNLFVGYFPASS